MKRQIMAIQKGLKVKKGNANKIMCHDVHETNKYTFRPTNERGTCNVWQ